MRVKLCGIRSRRDLDIACTARADALGVICGVTQDSPDALTSTEARALVEAMPDRVDSVLVSQLTDLQHLDELTRSVGARSLQAHGDLDPDALARLRERLSPSHALIGVVHLGGEEALEEAAAIRAHVDALLLDSRTPERSGGTGTTHDWSLSARIIAAAHAAGTPCILAGGLRPENLLGAIAVTAPSAVDVNSGVEDRWGDKDAARTRAFVDLAHAAPAPALGAR